MSSQSHVITPQRAHELALNQLLRVFSEHDPAKRKTFIPDTYTPDILMFESGDRTLQGHDQLHNQVTTLLTEREGWGFKPISTVKLNADFVYVAWGMGPKGGDGEVDVKVTGADHFFVKEDSDGKMKISTCYVIVDPFAEVKL